MPPSEVYRGSTLFVAKGLNGATSEQQNAIAARYMGGCDKILYFHVAGAMTKEDVYAVPYGHVYFFIDIYVMPVKVILSEVPADEVDRRVVVLYGKVESAYIPVKALVYRVIVLPALKPLVAQSVTARHLPKRYIQLSVCHNQFLLK